MDEEAKDLQGGGRAIAYEQGRKQHEATPPCNGRGCG